MFKNVPRLFKEKKESREDIYEQKLYNLIRVL